MEHELNIFDVSYQLEAMKAKLKQMEEEAAKLKAIQVEPVSDNSAPVQGQSILLPSQSFSMCTSP